MPHPDVIGTSTNEKLLCFRRIQEAVSIGFKQSDRNQRMKERRGLSAVGSSRSRNLFGSERSIFQRGEEIKLHTREHGEGGIDRVCQGFDCLRDGPQLSAHVATSQTVSVTMR